MLLLERIMTLESLVDSLPAYANDVKLNWRMAVKQTELTPLQLWGSAVASALAARNQTVLEAVTAEAAQVMDAPVLEAARAASAIMSTSNIYYRFIHLAEHEKYSTIPAHLRANAGRGSGAPGADFELWCVAVSAVNGCGACIQAHEKAAREKGLSEEAILAAVRIASVIHAIVVVHENTN
jgi:alkyl hydroperoxide reductase subunit D